jgi:hypothetical protein
MPRFDLVPIPDIMVPQPDGITKKPMLINCHQAVCYWLYQSAFGKLPMLDDFITPGIFGNSTGLITELAALGTKLKPNDRLIPDSVLIITDIKMVADHSCMVRFDGKIVGYNHGSWFKTFKPPNEYASLNPEDIWWNYKSSKIAALSISGTRPAHLFQVNDAVADNFIKKKLALQT